MRRALVASAVLAFALTGCAQSEDDAAAPTDEPTASSAPSEAAEESASAAPSPSPEPEDGGVSVRIEIEGDRITPNGKLVEATAGEPVTLELESDRAAELHVHSSPEQEIGVEKGSSTVELTIDRPGVVDVEEHDSGVVIIQLQVR